MLDGVMRRIVTPPLDGIAAWCAARGIAANAVTLLGAAFGLACGACIAVGWFMPALACLAASRIADGLDGAIARRSGITDFGGYLDIVCDFVFYSSVPVGFAILDSGRCAVAASLLLASFYLNGASFLGFSALAAKRGMDTDVRGRKSLYFTTGLMEGSETIAFFAAFLIWPEYFPVLAPIFTALCLVTMLARMALAWRVFSVEDSGRRQG
ncbi:MAG TPA: CDP-alcohol phosphatidyltransferase family protein [Beijerinckiaceae bacterium]|nr:CDP-alcohol phosphatidyltransferase family protein [Beijerinckiaceae bacterium]